MQAEFYLQTLEIAGWIGGAAFAVSGFLVAVRKNLDAMGVFVVAFLTANGGGALRDLLVQRRPVILREADAFWLICGVLFLAWLLRLHRFDGLERRWCFVVTDAIGLVAFAITGALVGIEEDLHFFGVVSLSLLTATGGGIIRDLLVNETPEVLHAGFYGSVALLLGAGIYALHAAGMANPLTLAAIFTAALATRMVAYRKNWYLPKLG